MRESPRGWIIVAVAHVDQAGLIRLVLDETAEPVGEIAERGLGIAVEGIAVRGRELEVLGHELGARGVRAGVVPDPRRDRGPANTNGITEFDPEPADIRELLL